MRPPLKNLFSKTVFLSRFAGKNSTNSKSRLRQNFAGEVIGQGEDDQNQKPKETGAGDDPGEAGAVAHVHEIEQHQQRLAGGDGHGDVNVQPAGVVKGHVNGDEGQQQQRDENQNVNFLWDDDVF